MSGFVVLDRFSFLEPTLLILPSRMSQK